MYLDKPNDKQWLVDIETDGLDATIIWCMGAINIGTGEERLFTEYPQMRDFINEAQDSGCVFVGHNFVTFDAPTINRLLGTRIGISSVLDTYLLSSLYSPNLAGGHSLEAWGLRVGYEKGKFDDWVTPNPLPERNAYCLRDCRLNVRVFIRLTDRMRAVGFSERCCEIEHRAWAIIKQQQRNGFAFDVPKAMELYAEIRQIEKELKDEIYKRWPPELQVVKTFARAFKNDGSPSSNYERHSEQYPKLEILEGGGYRAYDWVEFSLGSPAQRVEKLLELGWKPKEFTETGKPQATRKGKLVPSLEAFLEKTATPEVQLLAEWIAINARGNMIASWLDIQKDGFIHGSLWLAGSLRYRHDKPNTANIPAVRIGPDHAPVMGRMGQYTFEARDLWTTRNRTNRSLVGVDAKGIQLRVLAHYLNNDEFTKELLNGDPHEYNRSLAGIDTRAKAKTFIYAFLLGAGDEKVGEIIGGSKRDGANVKSRFINNFPGLSQLLGRLGTELDRTGRITLCDGAKVLVPSPHAALGYLLQGDESRIMKQAMIFINEEIRRRKLDVLFVGNIHDELQMDALKTDIDQFIEVCNECFKRSGESFGYRVPIDCDSKIGSTWSQTH